MGYYTEYSLEVKAPNSHVIIQHFRDVCDGARYALYDNGYAAERVKWYESEADVTNFSKLYPEALFILEGHGEGDGDFWRLYVKNGKSERCLGRIVYDKPEDPELGGGV